MVLKFLIARLTLSRRTQSEVITNMNDDERIKKLQDRIVYELDEISMLANRNIYLNRDIRELEYFKESVADIQHELTILIYKINKCTEHC